LDILDGSGFTVKLSKCVFATKVVTFLGYQIDQHTIRPASQFINKVANLQPPKDVTGVKSVVGTLQYVRRMVPYFSQRLDPIVNLTRKGVKFEWTPKHQELFDEIKSAITKAPFL